MLACRASAAPRLLWSTLISLLQLCGDSVRTEMRAGYSEQPEVQILGPDTNLNLSRLRAKLATRRP